MKRKIALIAVALGAMALTACGETTPSKGGSSKPTSSSGAKSSVSSVAPVVTKYKVTIKEDGKSDVVVDYDREAPITKPADPAAQPGKVFYGWKNTNNGGQIWNFDDEELNRVMDDVVLEPCFVPQGLTEQKFEAELCPDIVHWKIDTETGDWIPLKGSTYSGGQSGKGLVGKDYDNEIGATTIGEFEYYRLYDTQEDLDDDTSNNSCADFAELYDEIPPAYFKKKAKYTPNFDSFVHFMYDKGDTLTWKVNSDKAATNVTLFARFTAEYGKKISEDFDEMVDPFNDGGFRIMVNGVEQKYGSVKLRNVKSNVGGQYLHCQDYFISGAISLNAGENTIQMLVDNEDSVNGTITASAPCVDSIKLYSNSTITWPNARPTNLVNK